MSDPQKQYITQVTLYGDENPYYIKDAEARTMIENIKNSVTSVMNFRGKTTRDYIECDGSTTNPIKINDKFYTAKAGDIVIVDLPSNEQDIGKGIEYIFDGDKWQEFGVIDKTTRDSIANYQPLINGTQNTQTSTWTGNAPFQSLVDGQKIIYYLPYGNNNGNNVTLNLMLPDGVSRTGDLPCYVSGSTRMTTEYSSGSFIPLIYRKDMSYDGNTFTGWWAYNDKDTDNNRYLQLSNNKLKAGTNGIHGSQIVMQTSENTWESLTTSYSSETNKQKSSSGFYINPIFYHNNSQIVTNGNYTGSWRIMEQNSNINFAYSSNCGDTLTPNKSVYLVGTINNGLFYLDDQWWTQDLPTSDDNKVYIYIGIAFDTHNISKTANNPAFWFNNGCVEKYSGIKNVNSNITKAYLLGTTTRSGLQIYDTDIYSTEVAGRLNVKSLQIDETAVLDYNNNNESINFSFNN